MMTDYISFIRVTVIGLTSERGKKTASVLAHSFLHPCRANSGFTLSIYPQINRPGEDGAVLQAPPLPIK